MKEPIIQTWDDLILTEQGDKVPADRTVTFGYDGRYFEIDLTREHAEYFGDFMARYIKAASQIEDMPKKKPNKRHPDWYYEQMRAFADSQLNPRLKYRQESNGKYTYPVALRREFEKHLEEIGGRR